MAAWIYTADGEFESLAEAIEAYKERVRKQEQEEHRAALQAAQHDPQVQSWIELGCLQHSPMFLLLLFSHPFLIGFNRFG